MSAPSRPGLALALLAAALGLTGCLTSHAKVHVSQAVLDARAHRDVVQPPACPPTPLADASPVVLTFAFDEAALDETSRGPLAGASQWLACRSTPAVIRPDADGHGTAAEQDQLARRRAEVVRDDLAAQGVAANRIRILPRGQAAPGGDVFVIDAEGRRW